MADFSSSLSSTVSDIEPPAYYTPDRISTKSTQASSPGEHGTQVSSDYHGAIPFPRELRERIQIQIEEQYYAPAINLLSSLLHVNPGQSKQVLVPSPSVIALLATLAVHPQHTSSVGAGDRHEVQALSISYLRSLLATVGPVNAKLRDAFSYYEARRRPRSTEQDFLDNEGDNIRGKLANSHSIWTSGKDFFKVLGWAFNCAAHYPHRWQWWKPWIEYMVLVLEKDYAERKKLDEAASEYSGALKGCDCHHLKQSLLVEYVVGKGARISPIRSIVSALFADGTVSSMASYQEVFRKERHEPVHGERKRKREALDLGNGHYGDYGNESSEEEEESGPQTPSKTEAAIRDSERAPSWSESGLEETVTIRLRLFKMLSQLGHDMPEASGFAMGELYDKFEESVRQLPLDAFEMFVATYTTALPNVVVVSIMNCIIPAYMPHNAPSPASVDPETSKINGLNSLILEKCYLPFAPRASVEIHAKLSLVLETMLRILCDAGLEYSEELEDAVRVGVSARNKKITGKRYGNVESDGSPSVGAVLKCSGQRLLAVVSILRGEAGLPLTDMDLSD